MENITIYALKASTLTALFYIAYLLLLKKETFFTANRWFLLSGLFTSALLPLAFYTKTIIVKRTSTIYEAITYSVPQSEVTPIIIPQEEQAFTINWYYVALTIYLCGILVLLIKLFWDLYKIKRIIKGKPIIQEGQYKIVDNSSIKLPFSFFKYIVLNTSVLKLVELENILEHEKVHSRQKHSADMLLGQLFCIVFWFNPLAWLYKKVISQNLEFIADSETSKLVSDTTAYQKTLLKFTLQQDCIAITNHFYQSLIKKRIVMLNTPKSKRRNFIKYTLILPALTAFIMLFQIRTVAQEKIIPRDTTPQKEKPEIKGDMIAVEIKNDFSNEALQREADFINKQCDLNIQFEDVQRNDKGEIYNITIVADKSANLKRWSQEEYGKAGLKPFYIVVEKGPEGESIVMIEDEKFKYTANSEIIFDTHEDPATGQKNTVIKTKNVTEKSSATESSDVQPDSNNRKFYTYSNSVDTVLYKSTDDINKSISQRVTDNTTGRIRKYTIVKETGINSNEVNANEALILIDGKEASPAMIKSLNQDNIAKIDVSKVTEDNVAKYGEKARKGVILVTTKPDNTIEEHVWVNSKDGKPTETKYEYSNNTSFIIHKENNDYDLQAYAAELKKTGIIMTWKGLKRNADGEITYIALTLKEADGSYKISGIWSDEDKDKPIPNIYVGRLNGKLRATSTP
ncbi:hypothetical protein FUA48_15680 [Flavobacterium alkalisoli]|uniref:Peptidase M56 domain-containing protein n=1 Tax=Flavobacterium alkalisoli TaxID=2602769 RepID=A0A5B9FVM5_9FLAO|nr:M56 family metallopeptidase [Flavobacterium alkalisoli]QEE50965.1 hypothetical protein FUA48_15680 [Flavobacterium alkalisoli]